MNVSHKIFGFIKSETAQFIAVLLCVLLLFWVFGCESSVQSLDGSGVRVTRPELIQEVESFMVQAEKKFKILDQKDELKKLFADKLLLFSETGKFNPAGVIASILSILGIGAIADNTRKRLEIKRISNKPLEVPNCSSQPNQPPLT